MLLNCGVGEDSWTERKSSQSILKEISPEYSLAGLMLKLKRQYFGHLRQTHWKRPWFWERQQAGGGEDRGWDGWMASPTQWTWVWAHSGRWWRAGKPGCSPWSRNELDTTERLNNRTTAPASSQGEAWCQAYFKKMTFFLNARPWFPDQRWNRCSLWS